VIYSQEFWCARELQKILEYTEWRNFINVINKAKEACKNSKNSISDHFVDINKMVDIDSGATRKFEDIQWLSDFQNRKIDVKPKDPLKVEMKIISFQDENKSEIKYRYNILKVLEVIQFNQMNQMSIDDM